MRKNTKSRELVRPTIMRFSTHFLALQSILSQVHNLKTLLSNDEWNGSQWYPRQGGKDTKIKFLKALLIKKRNRVCEICRSPYVVVIIWGKLTIGYIYETINHAKEKIKKYTRILLTKYWPIWEIIANILNNQLHFPIDAARCFLNTMYLYELSQEKIKLERSKMDYASTQNAAWSLMRVSSWKYVDRSMVSLEL